MSSSESTTNVTVPHITSSVWSSTTTATNTPDEIPDWAMIGVIIAIAIFVFAIILRVYWFSYQKPERNSDDLPGRASSNDSYTDFPFKGRGLQNLGNTCYFNSAIQCLASTPVLRSQVLKTIGVKEVTSEFLRFLSPIDPESVSISGQLDPQPLLTAFCAKVSRFRGTQQHDSHELFRHFLDQLRQEERASWPNVNPNKQLTAVDKVFGGHFMTVYICENCKTPYHICEPFLDISVPICLGNLSKSETLKASQTETIETESSTSYQEAVESMMEPLNVGSDHLPAEILSITDCLQYFTRQEMLGQQYMCNSCVNDSFLISQDQDGDTKLTPATKQTLILNPPAVLVIHLKRFEMKKPRFEKRSNIIKFEELLDLAPYCSSWCLRNEDRAQNIWYSLYGVVVHSGSLTSGHYVAYVKDRYQNSSIETFLQNEYFDRDVTEDQLVEMMRKYGKKGSQKMSTKCVPSQGIWYCMNDSRVSEVSVDKVLEKEAFLLFYERVQPMKELDSALVLVSKLTRL